MTLRNCIINLQAQGQLDAARAQLFLDVFEDLEQSYGRSMGRAAAAARASEDTLKRIENDLFQKKRQAALQVTAQKEILANLERLAAEGVSLGTAAIAHFSQDARVRGVSNLEARHQAILQQAWGKMNALFEEMDRLPFVGLRQPARMKDIGRATFGEAVDAPWAREIAEAWNGTAEWLRQRFNMAGGHIGKLDGWGLPTRWDGLKVRTASYADFRAEVLPRLDLEKMIDERTGAPFTEATLERFLVDAYQAIRSDGWSRNSPGSATGRGMIGNQRAEHRFFRFKSFDDWLAVQERFGAVSQPSDIYDLMMAHIDGMAREIAAMEILGPNPDATVRWLTDVIQKDAAMGPLAGTRFESFLDDVTSAQVQVENMWALFTGRANIPVRARLARGFSAVRSILTSAMLGSAAITAVTDVGYGASARLFNGLPQAGLIRDYLTWMAPLTAAEKKRVARETGIMARQAAQQLGTLWRYTEEANVPGWAARIASGVLDISLLTRWTETGRALMAMEIQAALAREAATPWAKLNDGMRGMLERYGIGETHWDALRATPLSEADGLKLLRPDVLAARTDLPPGVADELATRMWEMLATEANFAVPDATLRARAVIRGGRRPGSWVNELANSAFQFKTFPVSLIYTQLMRAWHGRGAWPRWAHAAHLLAGTTIFGALAHQMSQIANGRDPQDMNDPRFWQTAMLKGGGLGIYGDFLFADQTRGQTTMTQALAGPLIGTASQLGAATFGNLQRAARGEETRAARDLVRVVRTATPGNTLWYARLAADRLFWDEINQMVDPDYYDSIRRIERRAWNEFGQEFWWRPGEDAPERAPDLSAAMGDGR